MGETKGSEKGCPKSDFALSPLHMRISLHLHTVPQAIGVGYLHLTEEEIEAQKNQGKSQGSHSSHS